jgi:hypothetical protein
MENVKAGSYQLIFQHIGYEIYVEVIQVVENRKYNIDALLLPLIYSSEEIQVSTTEPREWQNQLEFFIREFIGESNNAEYCKILNPEVLDFQVEEDSKKFTATTDSVIRIKNNSLGYQIDLVLVDFVCKNDYLSKYFIYPKFKILESKDQEKQEQWLENRENTYISSLKHFLSSLARGKMSEENFNMFRSDNMNWLLKGRGNYVDVESLRIADMRSPLYKSLFLSDFLLVSYSPEELYPPSIIYLNQNYIVIDTLGNVLTPESVKIAGEWYKKRVADILPMEYLPSN